MRICTGDVCVRSITCSGSPSSHVERVLHRAGRVAGREVERFEVVPVDLDLGTFGDRVAQADEDVFELAPDARDEVQVPAPVAVAAEREVEAVAHERRGARVGAASSAAARRDRCLERGLRAADRLADRGAVGARRRS